MFRKIVLFILGISQLNIFANSDIDVNFKDLQLKNLIQITSKVIGKEITAPKDIKGVANYRSDEKVSKKYLLKILNKNLNTQGYSLALDNDQYQVIKQKKPKLKDKSIQKEISIVELNNIQAGKIIKMIKELAKHFAEDTPFVSFDLDSNAIVMMGKKEHLEQLKATIQYLDKKYAQVFVEAKIIEVSSNRVKNFGMQYGIVGGMIGSDGIFSYAANMNGVETFDQLSTTIFNIKNLQKGLALGAAINLLKQNMALDIVSEPSLLCVNNQEASIYVGKTLSILSQTTGTGETQKDSYSRENIGLSLKIKPKINNEGKINLNIETILEDIDTLQGSNDQPITSKKQVQTTAILNHGESVILGGLIKNQKSYTIQKIPLLGEVPILGALFQNRSDINDKINLVIVVTPYIIQPNEDLTYAREQLSKIKILENEYTKQLINNLMKRKK